MPIDTPDAKWRELCRIRLCERCFEHEPPSIESAKHDSSKSCKSSSSRKQTLKLAPTAAVEASGASEEIAIISADEAKESPFAIFDQPCHFSSTVDFSHTLGVAIIFFSQTTKGQKPSTTELTHVPVGPYAKGEGLPYAPEGFPWGCWDRFLWPSARLQKRKPRVFSSKPALEKYMRNYFLKKILRIFSLLSFADSLRS